MTAPIIDCLTVVTPLAAHAMKGSGVRGCVLYVDRTLPNSKNAVLGAGLELASNYETTGRSGTGGRATGIREAKRLIELHVAAGGPSGIVLWLSPFDFDMYDVRTAQDYIDGAVSVLHPLRYKAGFYGSAGLGQNTHGWDAWWQCESTGYWNNRYPWGGAAIVQRVPLAASFAGVQTDGNLLQQPDNWGSWSTLPPPPPPPPPPPKVRPMYDPPLAAGLGIAAVWTDQDPGTPSSLRGKPGARPKVLAAVAPNGDVYAWGVPYRKWPKQQTDFVGRHAARIGQAPHQPDGVYMITDTAEETYIPPD